MPLLRSGRPLKRWRWVGVFSPELMLCVGDARIAGVPRRWWAIAEPDGTLRERTTGTRGGVEVTPGRVKVRAEGAEIDLELDEQDGTETASPAGRSYAWTRKQANVPVRGNVDGEPLEAEAFIDDSAGYHERHASWHWSAGVGRTTDGRSAGWNLVAGIHDAPEASERTVWLDGEAHEVGPVDFAVDLSAVGDLRFSEWCAREEKVNRLLFSTDYRQPFGTFSGRLPGGAELAEGLGVMERHRVRW